MYKIALLIKVGEWNEREDLFFNTKREAQAWLKFYRRTNNFVDNNGRHTPIVNSYMMKFSV